MTSGARSALLPALAVLAILLACGGIDDYSADAPRAPSLHVGDIAVVGYESSSGSSPFWLAADEEAYDLMTEAAVARDELGLRDLAARDRIYSVPEGTEVRVLDLGFLSTKVRVQEGEHMGRVGWQAREFVVPAGP